MRIVHVSTYDVVGGAAIAAFRLHRGLVQSGIDSLMFVRDKASQDPTVRNVNLTSVPSVLRRYARERWARIHREKIAKDGLPNEVHTDYKAEFRRQDFEWLNSADVIHLHWISGFVDWERVIPYLASMKPLVWTLHDMNPFNGARHYQDQSSDLPRAFANWDASVRFCKKKVLDQIPTENLRLIAPSRWMAKQVAASELMGRFRIDVVPYGLDTREFCPLEDRNSLRRSLGIPIDKTIVGFIAHNISERRKGFHLLMEAFQNAPHLCRKVCLLTVGGAHVDVPCIEHIHLGSTNNSRILRLFYNAIDFFVCPSTADNLPNTVLEAMSCGTPTVAFDVGGIPDMVRPGSTGWLARPVASSTELQGAIDKAVSCQTDPDGFRNDCRAVACSEYASELQSSRIAAIYREFLRDAD